MDILKVVIHSEISCAAFWFLVLSSVSKLPYTKEAAWRTNWKSAFIHVKVLWEKRFLELHLGITWNMRCAGLPRRQWVLDAWRCTLDNPRPPSGCHRWGSPLASISAHVWVSSLTTYVLSKLLSGQVSHLKGQSFTRRSLSKIPHLLPKWCLSQGISSHSKKKKEKARG